MKSQSLVLLAALTTITQADTPPPERARSQYPPGLATETTAPLGIVRGPKNKKARAWAVINKSGSVKVCYRCDPSGTFRWKKGGYNVRFTVNVRGRPRITSVFNVEGEFLGATIGAGDQPTDRQVIWLNIWNPAEWVTGATGWANRAFSIVVY